MPMSNRVGESPKISIVTETVWKPSCDDSSASCWPRLLRGMIMIVSPLSYTIGSQKMWLFPEPVADIEIWFPRSGSLNAISLCHWHGCHLKCSVHLHWSCSTVAGLAGWLLFLSIWTSGRCQITQRLFGELLNFSMCHSRKSLTCCSGEAQFVPMMHHTSCQCVKE